MKQHETSYKRMRPPSRSTNDIDAMFLIEIRNEKDINIHRYTCMYM